MDINDIEVVEVGFFNENVGYMVIEIEDHDFMFKNGDKLQFLFHFIIKNWKEFGDDLHFSFRWYYVNGVYEGLFCLKDFEVKRLCERLFLARDDLQDFFKGNPDMRIIFKKWEKLEGQ